MLPFYKKVSYSMGRLGSSLLLTTVDFTGILVYVFVFEVHPFLTISVMAWGYFLIGISHWLTGFLSDKTKTRLGRRKPYVIVGAPLLAICAFFIYVPDWFIVRPPVPRADPIFQNLMFVYYFVLLSLFKFGYALLLTAYQAWLPEISDPNERPTISAMQNTANWIGDGAALVISFIAGFLFTQDTGVLTQTGILLITSICLLEVLLYLPCIAFIRESPDIVGSERSITYETKTVLRNRTFVGFFIAIGFWSFATQQATNTAVTMAQVGLQLTIEELLIAALTLIVGTIVTLYLWSYISKRFGKNRSLSLALLILAVSFPFTAILGLPSIIPKVVQVILWTLALAGGLAALYLFRYVGIADIAQVDRIKTGESRAAMYEGFQGVPLNTFQAIGTLLLAWLFTIGEVVPGDPSAGNYMLFWWGPIYAIFLVISFLILRFVDLDPDFEAIEKQFGKELER